jgi:hypothetical protein
VAALFSSLAIAVLCATLAWVGRIPWFEAGWAALAVALVFSPTGWWAPVGWRRRLAEATLLVPTWAIVMLSNPIQRRMLLPPLLALAAWAAIAAAWPRLPARHRTTVIVLLALSARAAVGAGLVGWPWWRVLIALTAGAAVAWVAMRVGGRDPGIAAALLAAVVPVGATPVLGAAAVVLAVALARFTSPPGRASKQPGRVPGLVGCAVLAMAVAPWGGLGIGELFPNLGWWGIAALTATLLITRWLPPGLAGALWMVAVLTVGPVLAPTPDRRGFVLGGEQADVDLPAGTGAPYVLDVVLEGADRLAPDTAIAWFRVGERTHRLIYPNHAAAAVGGVEPGSSAMWRPRGIGADAGWRPAVRSTFEVPSGVAPRLTRHPDLPASVTVVLETEGAVHPTPPRDRSLGWWLAAAAAVVAMLQLLAGTWRIPFAVVPWTLLVSGSLLARAWVEPLRLLGERHAVDLALAALMTAWAPAAVVWLRNRRVVLAAAALLVPIAAATPQLTPPLYGDEPFHLAVMESLLVDGDLGLANQLDLGAHPEEAIYDQDGDLLHSPVLGVLLLPGYAAAGRTGALVLLALVGAAAVALIARRARRLGVPESRLRGLVLVLATTYPVAVFAGQIWVELVGALAVAAILIAVTGGRGARWAAIGWALLATTVKTRLGLLAFPAALAAWWNRGRGRVLGVALAVGAAAAAAGVGWLTMGHPFGIYRRLHHILPTDPELALNVIGGLAFDPSGGLLFAAPLWLVAFGGTVALWRRGGPGERMLLIGCAATVAALLHSLEWYGGGSPPARYLVPMLPVVALAGGLILREPRRWRRLAEIALIPSLVVWWVLVTRPHLSINPGDGSWWASNALARSYLVDTAWLVPSFLVPRTSTWVVALVVVGSVAVLVLAARWRPSIARRAAAGGIALWLLGTAGVIAAVELRADGVVEIEAAQVRRHGGQPHPREGTFSRFSHRRGWMLRDDDGVTVPLNLPAGASVHLEGFLLGTAQRGAELELSWDGGAATVIRVRGAAPDRRLRLPDVPPAGRHQLSVTVRTRPHGAVVLDRVVVEGER